MALDHIQRWNPSEGHLKQSPLQRGQLTPAPGKQDKKHTQGKKALIETSAAGTKHVLARLCCCGLAHVAGAGIQGSSLGADTQKQNLARPLLPP